MMFASFITVATIPLEAPWLTAIVGIVLLVAGLVFTLFLFFLMQGIVLSGNVPPGTAEILKRLWLAGIVPLLIGLGIIFNGLFISKKIVELSKRETPAAEKAAPSP